MGESSPFTALRDSCNVPLAALLMGTKRLRTARRWHLPCCSGASPPRRLQPGRSRGRGSRAAVPGTQRCSAWVQKCSTCMQAQRSDVETQHTDAETQRTDAKGQHRDANAARGCRCSPEATLQPHAGSSAGHQPRARRWQGAICRVPVTRRAPCVPRASGRTRLHRTGDTQHGWIYHQPPPRSSLAPRHPLPSSVMRTQMPPACLLWAPSPQLRAGGAPGHLWPPGEVGGHGGHNAAVPGHGSCTQPVQREVTPRPVNPGQAQGEPSSRTIPILCSTNKNKKKNKKKKKGGGRGRA